MPEGDNGATTLVLGQIAALRSETVALMTVISERLDRMEAYQRDQSFIRENARVAIAERVAVVETTAATLCRELKALQGRIDQRSWFAGIGATAAAVLSYFTLGHRP